MRLEFRVLLIVAVALTLGATCAESYARFASGFYAAATRLVAIGEPWRITKVEVATDPSNTPPVLRLFAEVRRRAQDVDPAVRAVTRMQVAAVIQVPLIFWTTLLAWPHGSRRRLGITLALGVPVFLLLEVLTTALQLTYKLAAASLILAGHGEQVPMSEYWSGFLEDGGRFVVVVVAALFVVGAARWLTEPRTVPQAAPL